MVKKIVFFASLLFVIVSFQNCSQPPESIQQESNQTSVDEKSFNKYSTDGVQNIVMWDFERQQFLDLNLESGQILPFEQYGSDVSKTAESVPKCASSEDLAKLNEILQGSSICEPVQSADQFKDRACTMLYEYPYASLLGGGDEVKLGERTSGCDQPVDLCGDKAALLKQFVTTFIQNLDQKNCQ